MKLQHLTDDDARHCSNRKRSSYPDLVETFNADMHDVEMTILRDEGAYRHLQFRKPKTTMYWFDLITWPGYLTITGDMGTYTFSRLRDMFEFFTGHINTDYWAEKLKFGPSASSHLVQTHSDEVFVQWVIEDFWETSRDLDPTETKRWWDSIKQWILPDATNAFYSHYDPSDRDDCIEALLGLTDAPEGHYNEVWEVNWSQYDWHFEYNLAAILIGIRTYRAYHATQLG